jgi:hypothetical protein
VALAAATLTVLLSAPAAQAAVPHPNKPVGGCPEAFNRPNPPFPSGLHPFPDGPGGLPEDSPGVASFDGNGDGFTCIKIMALPSVS